MILALPSLWKILIGRVTRHFKVWTKPTTARLVMSSLADLPRSRTDLIAENAMLRQQLIILNRQVKRPKLSYRDRIRLVFLARCTQFWQNALHIVQPDTLLRWHRDLFRLYWRWKSSRTKRRRQYIPQETIDLIKQMANENPLWGAEKIRGELLKLAIEVSKRTVQRYMPKVRRKTGQHWATFLKNHAGNIWACDFTVVYDLLFRPIYVFIIMEMKTRRIVQTGVTSAPTDAWTAQQLREATPWGTVPKYLIHDRDSKYGKLFSCVANSSGIKELKTPFQAPKANAVCERTIGSLKRECLDHMFILNQSQLQRILNEYVSYYNHHRSHQGIQQKIPARLAYCHSHQTKPAKSKIISRLILEVIS